MAAFRLLLVASLLALPLWGEDGTRMPASAPSKKVLRTLPGRTGRGWHVGEMAALPPESVEHPETLVGGRIPTEIKFNVSEYIKGSGPPTVLVYQATNPSAPTSCDMFFRPDDQYVLVLRR
jgi:hypothetical protein